MTSRHRLARLNEQLKRELAELIRTDVRDPRVGLVTVTDVDVTSDLSVARVYVRALGETEEVDEALAGLEAAAPFLRGSLGKELSIRRIPELRFQRDRSLEHATRIEEILSEVLPEDEPADDSDEGGGPDG
ncbi:MAG: 30S ribosome-binding factor RbfA [Gemmatimonadota bacterium]|nr:30S ribosome-binding factor RbfA [Gemmatimonadota bacterium]